MRLEIRSAVNFLTALLRTGQVREDKLEFFSLKLQEVLGNHYRHHWFPEKPFKGSAYRCIRINHKMDPLVAEAGQACGFNESMLFSILPYELTLWIDPCEVSYRIGENGSVCVLLDSKSKSMERYSSAATSCKETYSGLSESINMKFAAVVSS